MRKGLKKRVCHSRRLFIFFLESDTAQTSVHPLRSSIPAKFQQPEMVRTRGAKTSSPSSRKKVPREEPVPDPISEPPRPKAVSPPVKPAPPKPPVRRYLTMSGDRPLQKRARVESSEPIDLTEPSPVPSPVPSPTPPAEPKPPLLEPQIPAEIAPEEIIRRPMLI